jgi:hypothetical protein
MAYVWAMIGIALAAFCVWLAVRIINRREKWAMRTAAITGIILIAYPVSTGPGTWLLHHYPFSKPAIRVIVSIYEPLGSLGHSMPLIERVLGPWQELFIDMGWPSVLKEREERERVRRRSSVNPPAHDPDDMAESS